MVSGVGWNYSMVSGVGWNYSKTHAKTVCEFGDEVTTVNSFHGKQRQIEAGKEEASQSRTQTSSRTQARELASQNDRSSQSPLGAPSFASRRVGLTMSPCPAQKKARHREDLLLPLISKRAATLIRYAAVILRRSRRIPATTTQPQFSRASTASVEQHSVHTKIQLRPPPSEFPRRKNSRPEEGHCSSRATNPRKQVSGAPSFASRRVGLTISP
jgi:hypothetical protein